jgi:hypothetical protein
MRTDLGFVIGFGGDCFCAQVSSPNGPTEKGTPLMVDDPDNTAPAPSAVFTRAGRNVGGVATAITEFEKTGDYRQPPFAVRLDEAKDYINGYPGQFDATTRGLGTR